MPERIPEHGRGLPDEYQADLHPDAGRDQNVEVSQAPARDYATAHDVKDVHRRLAQLNDDQLKRIPVIPAGTRLRQGAVYADLASDDPAEFTATADLLASDSQRLVAKDEVDHETWNVLLGREDRPPLSEG